MNIRKFFTFLFLVLSINISRAESVNESLRKAILNDSENEIKQALKNGANINLKSGGLSPLVFALLNKKSIAVEALLNLNAETDKSLIQYAISARDIKTAFKLEQKHSKPNSLYLGKNLLDHALLLNTDDSREISLKLILWSIKNNGACAIKEISYSNKPLTIMQYAIVMYDRYVSVGPLAQEIIYELINRGYNVNDIWSMGINWPDNSNSINIYRHPKALKLFLDKGADPNFLFNIKDNADNWGMWTPLNFATWIYNLTTIEILLKYGADINRKSHINIIYTNEKKNGLYNPLSIAMAQAATRGDHFLKIIEFLLKNGAC